MTTTWLLDTGPLVAVLDRTDRDHQWADQEWRGATFPLWTCEAVLTEACYLLRGQPAALPAIGRLLVTGAVHSVPVLDTDAAAVFDLMRRYRNVPMSLADACLVRLAERRPDSVVFTLDSAFLVYRRAGGQPLAVTLP